MEVPDTGETNRLLTPISYTFKTGPQAGKCYTAFFVQVYCVGTTQIAELLDSVTFHLKYIEWGADVVNIDSIDVAVPIFFTPTINACNLPLYESMATSNISISTMFPNGFKKADVSNVMIGIDVLNRKWTITSIQNSIVSIKKYDTAITLSVKRKATIDQTIKRGKYKCSKCGESGHNQRKCMNTPVAPKEILQLPPTVGLSGAVAAATAAATVDIGNTHPPESTRSWGAVATTTEQRLEELSKPRPPRLVRLKPTDMDVGTAASTGDAAEGEFIQMAPSVPSIDEIDPLLDIFGLEKTVVIDDTRDVQEPFSYLDDRCYSDIPLIG
jgi:hypothetical protein